jgi:hypothetical protein
MLASVHSRVFANYTEGAPLGWRSSFAVCSFRQSEMLMPELCLVVDEDAGVIQWRGRLITV